ncbi:putative phosphoglycerate mutase family protein [Gordonia araii NBRC 100433]|uniref:Putative phosphoglycerate mutase family protein n=2 Tax=Gordonia araii TaxID=263909 RepID=G7H4G7_9ACTN|nr:histidine phosphatase family protein [Gordonia araii]GAB10742.1 putative phosphoglycerate mutase family protein [Gordonia araii NBRC 100433]
MAGPDTHDTSVERLTPVVRRLVLWRHGETHYNAASRMQGQLDTDLSERGHRQAIAAASALAQRDPLLIRSSDLRRAAETADQLGKLTGLGVDRDPRLRETHLGRWQGLTHAEVDAVAPGARRIWRDDATWSPPEGESRVDVAERIRPVVDDLLVALPEWGSGQRPESPVVLVAHGGSIAALTASLLQLPVANWPVLGGLANAGWVQLSGHELAESVIKWRLDVWNSGVDES